MIKYAYAELNWRLTSHACAICENCLILNLRRGPAQFEAVSETQHLAGT